MKYYARDYSPTDHHMELLMSFEEVRNKLDIPVKEYHYNGGYNLYEFVDAYIKLFEKLGCDVDPFSGGFFIVPSSDMLQFDLYYMVKGDNNGTVYICGTSLLSEKSHPNFGSTYTYETSHKIGKQ